MKKIIATSLYYAFSAFCMLMFIAGWFGMPEPDSLIRSLFGLFFAKVIGVMLGTLAVALWFIVRDYVKRNNYVYNI